MSEFITWTNAVPDVLVYLLLSVGAALENIFPALPADTFVALGGFLAGAGDLDARWVVLGTWLANVTTALAVYRVSRVRGPDFFEHGWGRYVMKPHQMQRMGRFYERWGLPAIFFSRFLPGVRAVVPVFAGATHQPVLRVVVPIVVASALWYGGLVGLGVWAGQNLELLGGAMDRLNTTLGIATGLVTVTMALWWWFTRRHPND